MERSSLLTEKSSLVHYWWSPGIHACSSLTFEISHHGNRMVDSAIHKISVICLHKVQDYSMTRKRLKYSIAIGERPINHWFSGFLLGHCLNSNLFLSTSRRVWGAKNPSAGAEGEIRIHTNKPLYKKINENEIVHGKLLIWSNTSWWKSEPKFVWNWPDEVWQLEVVNT